MRRNGSSWPAIARAIPWCAKAIILAAAVTACGSMTGAGAGAGTGSSTGGAAVGGCSASSLRVTLDSHAAGAAAGSSFFPLDFTNISHSACRLAGYPVVSFAASSAGRQLGTVAALDRGVKARPVALAPGATAHAWLQVVDALNYPASQCHPVMADGLRVSLPGQRQASYLQHAFPACAAAMRGSEILTVQPIQPGRARHGTAQ